MKKGGRSKYVELSDESADDGDMASEDDFPKKHKHSPGKKRPNGNSHSFSPAKKSKKFESDRVIYKEDSEEDFTDAGEIDDGADSDFEDDKPKKKRGTPAKRKSAVGKKGKRGRPSKKEGKTSGRKKSKKPKYASSSDEESEEEEEEEEYDSDDEIGSAPVKQRKIAKQSKKSVVKKPELPRVGEMVVTAIKRLREKPRKGSSLAAIKGFLAEEWGLYIPDYVNKIKKFLLQAVESGEVIQTKGKGAAGRFTVPGMKIKKKKKKNALTKKWDEDQEPEYEPKKTSRDEQRERCEVEMEMKREQRREEEARRAELKASLPKKPVPARRTEWEVEMIKGMREKEDKTWYLVKWVGWAKTNWEPEENLGGCQDLIDNFLIEEKTKLREDEQRRRREEEEGHYEVARILEVKFIKGSDRREFLIRWKGHGPDDDTWEPEDNLDCEDLIERFMEKYEKRMMVSEKSLREAPKVVERLNYARSKRHKTGRVGKRSQGFRVTYEDMCE